MNDWLKLKNGNEYKIINKVNYKHVEIEFKSGYKTITTMHSLRYCNVHDPYFKFLCNIGYIGNKNNEKYHKSIYGRWSSMISRCYNKNDKDYHNYGAIGVIVCDDWHCYDNYAKWFLANNIDLSLCVDKDLLFKNNKIYSPETCCFLPVAINSILVDSKHGNLPYGVKKKIKIPGYEANIRMHGKRKYLGYFKTVEEAFNKYKEVKELYMKELADTYKDIISEQAYNALYNFTVSITD